MTNYSKYMVINKDREASFQFIESNTLPTDIAVSTPFNFPFIGTKIVLCLDKNKWWNPLGGHIEKGETYQDTILRESYEEAGVYISKQSIKIIGYILNTNTKTTSLSQYPPVNILPITTSFVIKVDSNWKPMETQARGLFSPKSALELMSKREDNNQMWEILKCVVQNNNNQNYQANFTYYPNKLFDNIPVTQVFTFCKNSKNKFCIVKDQGENFYSLPGGGCELGEMPEACIQREVAEEAQITCKNIRLLGSVLVELIKNGKVVSSFQHLRYLADVDTIETFVPLKNGFETDTREFVSFSELETKVFILQNPTAKNILNHVLSIL